jgi:hypothetical protein
VSYNHKPAGPKTPSSSAPSPSRNTTEKPTMKTTRTAIAHRIIDLIWPEISTPGTQLFTPDEIKGAEFTIIESNPTLIKIQTVGGSHISIEKESFHAALHFLLRNGHTSPSKACEIGSNNGTPGELDRVTRKTGPRVINYILPILATAGIVGINGSRNSEHPKNTTWAII